MSPELKQMIDKSSSWAEVAMRKDGEISSPIWIAVDSKGQQFVVPALSNNKDLAMVMVRALFDLRDVVRYVSIFEAWALRCDAVPGEDMPNDISDHPDRIEVISFSAEETNGVMVMCHRRIIRDKPGNPTLGPLETILEGGENSGRIIGLLPRRGAMQ